MSHLEDCDLFKNEKKARFFLTPGTQSTELIWLEHPKDSSLSRPWKVHGMSRGTADTFVRPAQLTVRDSATGTSRIYNALLTIGYFNKRLMIHWTENKQERWDDISDVRL